MGQRGEREVVEGSSTSMEEGHVSSSIMGDWGRTLGERGVGEVGSGGWGKPEQSVYSVWALKRDYEICVCERERERAGKSTEEMGGKREGGGGA